MAIQSLIQMMCREMLVLEEKELVCVEVKWKMERERKKEQAQRKKETGKRVDFQKRVFACIFVHMPVRD